MPTHHRTSENAPSGPGTPVHERRWIVLAILSGSLLLIAMDTTILNVAFPSLVADLQPGSVEQLWIIDAYALALSGLLVTAGGLGDRWGRKRLMLSGFGLFALASLGAVFATAPWQVIAARALLGVGGAAIMPATLSILRHVFTDAGERAFAYAVWSAVMGAGLALGPVVGGLLVEDFGWHAAFLLNIPVALAVIVLGLWLLPESRVPHIGHWDWWGVLLSVTGMVALAGGIKQLGKAPTAPLPWALLAAAAVLLTVFVRRQLHLARPLLEVRLFRDRAFRLSTAVIFLGMVGLGSVLFLLTQWFQYAKGYSPLEAGVRLLPAPLALTLTSVVTPRLMRALAVRHVMGGGLLLMGAGMALPYAVQRAGDGSLGYPTMAVALALLGFGAGIATTTASVTLMAVTPQQDVGGAAAIDETCYELGAAMGVAALGSLASALYRSHLPARDVVGAARDSVGEAAHAADELGGAAGQRLLAEASYAFTQGMTPAFLAGAVLAAVAAAMAWAWVPRDVRPTDNPH